MLIPMIGIEQYKYGVLDMDAYLKVNFHSDPMQAKSLTHMFNMPFLPMVLWKSD